MPQRFAEAVRGTQGLAHSAVGAVFDQGGAEVGDIGRGFDHRQAAEI